MSYVEEYKRIIAETQYIALATSVNNSPNVRVVNYCWDKSKGNRIYICTFMERAKTEEFMLNPIVSFTTIPTSGSEQVRVTNARVKKSERSVYDFASLFVTKYPSYKEFIENCGNVLDIYEISFEKASVVAGVGKKEVITF
ncbi:MAG: pyridoxamine 5'-phosphate oxidase family protein [Lachnospiraceae bacterium]|nr:pyridoxamine 5'-phosphate oxidase family protein [Lachnospiraceae bacterium]